MFYILEGLSCLHSVSKSGLKWLSVVRMWHCNIESFIIFNFYLVKTVVSLIWTKLKMDEKLYNDNILIKTYFKTILKQKKTNINRPRPPIVSTLKVK